MVEHRVLDDEELEEHDRQSGCTGLAAGWCPVHGNCDCRNELFLHDPECPLHSPTSTHAETD